MVSSSPSNQDQQTSTQVDGSKIVTIATAAAAASRRLPPPCWSHDETVSLIDAYREKWYTLRRGNLRASHWQDVADDVANRCPVNTPKTAVQCRHKMEKLRKRYRAEIQRAVPYGGGSRGQRYCSAWIHFKRMDAMEKGTNVDATGGTTDDDEDDEQEDTNVRRTGDVYNANNINNSSGFHSRNTFHEPMTNGGSGFRIRISGKNGGGGSGGAVAKGYSKFDEIGGQSNGNIGMNKGYGGRNESGKRAAAEMDSKKADPVEEMVEAIKSLGDGFVRMEKMKMEMAREVEEMRMDMEMKRTEMILESQQKIVEALAKAITEGGKNKKMKKRMPDNECQPI